MKKIKIFFLVVFGLFFLALSSCISVSLSHNTMIGDDNRQVTTQTPPEIDYQFDLEIEATQIDRSFIVVCENKEFFDSLSRDTDIYKRYHVKLDTNNNIVLGENTNRQITTYGVAKIYYVVNILTIISDNINDSIFLKLHVNLMGDMKNTLDLIGIRDTIATIFNPRAFVLTCYDKSTYNILSQSADITETYTVRLIDISNERMFDVSYEDGVGMYVNYDLNMLYDKDLKEKYRFVDHATN